MTIGTFLSILEQNLHYQNKISEAMNRPKDLRRIQKEYELWKNIELDSLESR